MMDENSAGCASEGKQLADLILHFPDTPAPTISQDIPAPAAVTAEMVRKAREAYAGSGREWPEFMAAHLTAALSAATPLQSDLAAENARLRAAIFDVAYNAFMRGRSGKNPDDGGPCDWFTDTRPLVGGWIEAALKIRAALQGADNHE